MGRTRSPSRPGICCSRCPPPGWWPGRERGVAGVGGEIGVGGAGGGGGQWQGRGAEGDLSLDLPLREAREAFERPYFEHHLAQVNGSIARVAERSGLERTHLYRKLKALGILAGRKED